MMMMMMIISESDEEDENFSYRFDCVAEGNPAPSVFWTKEVSWKRSSIWLGKRFILYPPQGNQDLVFAGTSHGTLHVSPQGSLSIQVLQSLLLLETLHSFQPSMVLSPSDIQGVRLEDEGFFVCSAFSVAGSLATKAYLEVTAVGNEPPPIIRVGRTRYLEQPFIVVDPADKKFS